MFLKCQQKEDKHLLFSKPMSTSKITVLKKSAVFLLQWSGYWTVLLLVYMGSLKFAFLQFGSREMERNLSFPQQGSIVFLLRCAIVLCKYMWGMGTAFRTLHSVVMEECAGSNNKWRALIILMVQMRSVAYICLF